MFEAVTATSLYHSIKTEYSTYKNVILTDETITFNIAPYQSEWLKYTALFELNAG